jgi:hypothetical protein
MRRTKEGHLHAEAFKLMTYAHGDKKVEVWNSRDGVTPFVIFVDGVELQHVNWERDSYRPWHEPKAGDWVVVDMTEAAALPLAEERMRKYDEAGQLEQVLHTYQLTREEVVMRWVDDYVHHTDHSDGTKYRGQPNVVQIDETTAERLAKESRKRRAEAARNMPPRKLRFA